MKTFVSYHLQGKNGKSGFGSSIFMGELSTNKDIQAVKKALEEDLSKKEKEPINIIILNWKKLDE